MVKPAFWSAAGSEAPRRFGFCGRARGRSFRSRLEASESAVAAALSRRTPKAGGFRCRFKIDKLQIHDDYEVASEW